MTCAPGGIRMLISAQPGAKRREGAEATEDKSSVSDAAVLS